METTNQIPKWFWIAIGTIVLITIFACMYCKYKAKQKAAEISDTVNSAVQGPSISDSMSVLNLY